MDQWDPTSALKRLNDVCAELRDIANVEVSRHSAVNGIFENVLQVFGRLMNEDAREGTKGVSRIETEVSERMRFSLDKICLEIELAMTEIRISHNIK